MSISQYILGVQPDYDGLKLVPCLPDELSECTVHRSFRDAEYAIHIRRTGERSMTVNGQAAQGDLIPVFPSGSQVGVELTIE